MKPLLTVKKLREYIEKVEERHGKKFDDYPIHLMVMDKQDAYDDSRASMATNVDFDQFDDEGGPCLSLTVWNEP